MSSTCTSCITNMCVCDTSYRAVRLGTSAPPQSSAVHCSPLNLLEIPSQREHPVAAVAWGAGLEVKYVTYDPHLLETVLPP